VMNHQRPCAGALTGSTRWATCTARLA
jgi:hypothetical protein